MCGGCGGCGPGAFLAPGPASGSDVRPPEGVDVRVLPVGALQCNCVLVSDAERALLVDPGGDAQAILAAVRELPVPVTDVVVTHAHLDHFYALPELLAAPGMEDATARLHRDDGPLWAAAEAQCRVFRQPAAEFESVPLAWLDGGEAVGAAGARVVHTPGHSPGSCCVLFGDWLCCAGDTLFFGSVGRTDLPGGSAEQLMRSIARELAGLPGDMAVVPGHGPGTTIGREVRENPFLSSMSRL